MDALPRELGPYEILMPPLGDGGTGLVLSACHRDSGDLVAIKTPKPDTLENRVALRREVAVLQRLARAGVRGVVQVLHQPADTGPPWYAMELVQGGSLQSFHATLWGSPATAPRAGASVDDTVDVAAYGLDDPPPPDQRAQSSPRLAGDEPLPVRVPAAAGQLQRALRILLRIAETVAQLHSEGVVHGDITPSNVLFRHEGDPVLIDFGTALVADAREPWREASTQALATRGTAGYLAPEAIAGEGVDARGDLYSLGCIMYELLGGRRPFAASSVKDVLQRQAQRVVEPLSSWVDGLPDELGVLVQRLMDRDPSVRLAQADEVCRVLRDALDERPPLLRPLGNYTTLFRSRLRGRDEALAALDGHLVSAIAGRGGFVLVRGSSGLGRTRLLQEFAKRALKDEAIVAAGQTEATNATPAALGLFTPVVERIANLFRDASQDSQVRAELEALDGLLETLRAGKAATSADEARGMAFRGLLDLLVRAAGKTPLILIFDDVLRADELSLAFLKRHAKQWHTKRILIVAACLDGPEIDGSELGGIADATVSLAPLGHADTRAMIRDLLGAPSLPDGLFEFVQCRANGNPFFIAEYVRAAMLGQVLRRVAPEWVFVSPSAREARVAELPESIERSFELRVEHLSEPAQRALEAACVFRHEFEIASFGSVAPAGEASAGALEELVAKGILHASRDGRYRFVHDGLRESRERRLPPAERVAHHRNLALHLESQTSPLAPERSAMLGYHWAHAGESARALEHLEVAGRAAAASFAPQRAADLFRLALEHCDGLSAPQERDARIRGLHEALSDVLLTRAEHREARENLEAALALMEATDGLARARVLRKLAASFCTLHDYPRAAELSQCAERELAAAVESAATRTELIQIRLGRFDQLYFSGNLGADLAALVEGLGPLIESHGSAEQACTYYFMSASHAFLQSRYAFDERALALARGGVRAAERASGRRGMAEFILGGALLMGTREQCQLALDQFRGAAVHAERVGDATLLSRIRAYEAIGWVRLGDVEQASLAASTALEAAEAAAISPYIAAARACQGWVAWRRGDRTLATSLLDQARARWNKARPHRFPFSNLAIFPLLDLAHTSDELEAAAALLGELGEGLPALPERLAADVQSALAAARSGDEVFSNALAVVLASARDAALM